MFLAVCDFTAVRRAAFSAAHVAFSAAVSGDDGGIRGVSDPLCHPPVEVLRLKRGGRSRPRCVSLSSGRTALRPGHCGVRWQCRGPQGTPSAKVASLLRMARPAPSHRDGPRTGQPGDRERAIGARRQGEIRRSDAPGRRPRGWTEPRGLSRYRRQHMAGNRSDSDRLADHREPSGEIYALEWNAAAAHPYVGHLDRRAPGIGSARRR
jgi:hypothetical protein